jgi:hypothetical protein
MESKEIPYVSMESKKFHVSMESKEIPYVSMERAEIPYVSMESEEIPYLRMAVRNYIRQHEQQQVMY